MPPAATPRSTYRLQFNHRFTFVDAARVVPYLDRLGVSDVYASPYLMARPGSMHGYDICDHTRLNPEVGSEADYDVFVAALREHRLGQILDFVPNHMGIDPGTNPWWRDVLENGQSSAFAHYFDIDWDPIKPELKGKVLLPILGDQYGLVLERAELRLGYADGALQLDYFDNHLPLNPREGVAVFEHGLEDLQQDLGEDDLDLREFLSVLTSLRNLPGMDEREPSRIAERRREKEVARERLAGLAERVPRIRTHIERAVAAFNGTAGDPASFDRLHALLEHQAYRLSYWRTASHEINYRRFFDVNALAALRMEDLEVFEATHTLVARLLATGAVTALRIDHPDGLYDPAAYFQRLQDLWRTLPREGDHPAGAPGGGKEAATQLYVLAEKILMPGEDLPAEWAVAGTTGYQFANDVNGVLLDPAGERPLRQFYNRYTKHTAPFGEIAYESKRLITRSSLASELNVLAHALNRLSESNRRSRDFTLDSLRALLQEVVACFPVYRTYVSPQGWTAADRERIETGVMRARWRNPAMEASIFDFFREVALPRREEATPGAGERRDGYAPGDPHDYRERLAFSMKLQQYTAPVQAKGMEDTAFYRYNPLISLNEVGGSPGRFGRSVAEFHEANRARQERWPLEMIATTTHDTKLGEDVRARISVLSQIPGEWRKHVARWTRINTGHRAVVAGEPAPDRNDEYRFYQVLVGVWPTPGRPPDARLVERLREYMTKATKEAKVHTSWVNDNQAYDGAITTFVERSLTAPGSARFLASFLPFQARVARLALANSLSQLILKIASPGVPDFYQGAELWDLRLVDPDNRAPVDFERRACLLEELEARLPVTIDGAVPDRQSRAAELKDLLEHWEDGRIKLWVTACGLRLRRAHPDLFVRGDYVPMDGPPAPGAGPGLVAFARTNGGKAIVALAPRLLARVGDDWTAWAGAWAESGIELPRWLAGRQWVNALSGERIEPVRIEPDDAGRRSEGGANARGDARDVLPLARVLSPCPVALLISEGR
jgi:(1->4)-alpha-D-glucan 1-alpha-D-glucosylmutase